MVMTLPNAFDHHRDSRATESCFIVKIDDGTTQWYFADRPLELQTVHVEPLVLKVSPIMHSLDPVTFASQPLNAIVTLDGHWTSKTPSGQWQHVLDRIESAWSKNLDILWYPGGWAQFLTDCLTIYKGTITDMTLTEDEKVVIATDEFVRIGHRVLPQRLATTTLFPNMPAERRDIEMPLVYGDFNESLVGPDLIHRFRGLALAELIDNSDLTAAKYLISDHVLSTNNNAWFYMSKVRSWAEIIAGATINKDDGGRGTLTIDFPNLEFDVYLHPSIGGEGAMDFDTITKTGIVATSATEASALFEWTQNGSSDEHTVLNGVAEILGGAGKQVCQLYKTVSGATITNHYVQVWGGASGWVTVDTATTTGSLYNADFSGSYSITNSVNGVWWHYADGVKGATNNHAFNIRVVLVGTGFTVGADIGWVHLIRLRVACKKIPNFPGSRYSNPGNLENKKAAYLNWTGPRLGDDDYVALDLRGGKIIFHYQSDDGRPFWSLGGDVGIECTGRTHGAYIDEGGRSNPLNSGQAIHSAPEIIENLLRDELGLTSNEIDVASFDVLYSHIRWNFVGRDYHDPLVNLAAGQTIGSARLIQSLCVEFGLWTFWSNAGKYKIIDPWLPAATVPTAATIRWDDFDGSPGITFTQFKDLANEITYTYGSVATAPRDFKRTYTVSDAASQALYGVRKATINLKHVGVQAAATPHYNAIQSMSVYSEDNPGIVGIGWRSRRRRIVSINTIGMKRADLELGDRIEFDDEQFDEMFRLPGISWSGVQFIIIRKAIIQDGIGFSAIQK